MLELKNICKDYPSGNDVVQALRNVSITFRDSEFVSVLGPSGCGKTTLLNIVGGLDQYTTGDLVIEGRSTKGYRDRDWDIYRNHTVGFVFQSYNLIAHQTVINNVELALTLSGVKRRERKSRALEALKAVGLEDQAHKKPNQLSGGQMQRVAIARALVNNPAIVLADEPTGALDTATSEQVMRILKEVSHDRLVIMVTHNPELAQEYSTRIVNLRDGQIVSDSDPYDVSTVEIGTAGTGALPTAALTERQRIRQERKAAKAAAKASGVKRRRHSMSPFTALGLSMRNLMTKKGRSILTAFAGSIGIIGIALILSLSNGTQQFISQVEQDTLSSYPITINEQNVDFSALMAAVGGVGDLTTGSSDDSSTDSSDESTEIITSNPVMTDIISRISSGQNNNDLTSFRAYLESEDGQAIYALANDIRYDYGVSLYIYRDNDSAEPQVASNSGDNSSSDSDSDSTDSTDSTSSTDTSDSSKDTSVLQVNPSTLLSNVGLGEFSTEASSDGSGSQLYSSVKSLMPVTSEVDVFQQLMNNEDVLESQYEVLAGSLPESYNEVVLIVDENHQVSDYLLYALGILDQSEVSGMFSDILSGEDLEDGTSTAYDLESFLGMTFKLVLPGDRYQQNEDGTWTDMHTDEAFMSQVVENSEELTIVGVICPTENSAISDTNGAIGYTSDLVEYVVEANKNTAIAQDQMAHPDIDVFTGLPFAIDDDETATDTATGTDAATATDGATAEDASVEDQEGAETDATVEGVEATLEENAGMTSEEAAADEAAGAEEAPAEEAAADSGAEVSMDDLLAFMQTLSEDEQAQMQSGIEALQMQGADDAQIVQTMTGYLEQMGVTVPAGIAQQTSAEEEAGPTVSDSTYEQNLAKIGVASVEEPTSIEIYAKDFQSKEDIGTLISEYNDKVRADGHEERVIQYSDYIGLMLSSVRTVIDAIGYILIAFVAISLVVSSIMIGIITYISVLERTKEIGVLRSVGASKADIRHVFNAETFAIGLAAGVIGIVVTVLIDIPANIVIHNLTGVANLAQLPPLAAVILIAISVVLTMIGGLIPAHLASKKDPVTALRTE